jgi:hypothetical protein
MPWFKVDDGFHAHRKVAKLGHDDSDAITLWTLAGSWSADQLTDGWVPEYVAARLDRDYERRAAALVRVGLWEEAEQDGEKGWQFHGWSEPGRNLTAEQVNAERAATAERQRRFRNKVKGTEERNAVTNTSVTDPRNAPVTDPLPFPSLPTEEVLRTSSSASRKRSAPAAKRGTRIPDDFHLTDDMRAWGLKNAPAVNGERETLKFINYYRSAPGHRGVRIDWDRTWQNWILKAADDYRAPTNGNVLAHPTANGYTPRPSATERSIAEAEAAGEEAKRILAAMRQTGHPQFGSPA